MAHVADRLRVLLSHRYVDGDDENDAILGAIVGAIGDAAERVGVVAFGDEENGVPAGRALSDPSVAPLWALPHAALYTGARLPGRLPGESDVDYLARARDAAVYPLGIRRGTHEAVRRAVRPYLTGDRTVFIADLYGGDEYSLLVRTRPEETPDPAAVRAALEGDFVSGGRVGAIRAELTLAHVVANFAAWREATFRWSDVENGVTWQNVTREDVT